MKLHLTTAPVQTLLLGLILPTSVWERDGGQERLTEKGSLFTGAQWTARLAHSTLGLL